MFTLLQVRLNPSGALNSLVYMCRAIASWQVMLQKLEYYSVEFDIPFSMWMMCILLSGNKEWGSTQWSLPGVACI